MKADAAIVAYYELRSGGAPSAHITRSLGWRWAARCRCGGTERTYRLKKGMEGRAGIGRDDYEVRCVRCGTVWEHEAVEEIKPVRPGKPKTLRSGVISPRGSTGITTPIEASELRLIFVADLERAIFPVPPFFSRSLWLVCRNMLIDHARDGVRQGELATIFGAKLHQLGIGTSLSTIERMLRRTRAAIEHRLRAF